MNIRTLLVEVLHVYKLDVELLQYYQVGLVLGVLLLSTLVLFPGNADTNQKKDDESVVVLTESSNENNTDNQVPLLTTPLKETKPEQPSEYNLQSSNNDAELRYTPYKKMNFIVWLILISGTIIVLHNSYNLSWLLGLVSGSREWMTLNGIGVGYG